MQINTDESLEVINLAGMINLYMKTLMTLYRTLRIFLVVPYKKSHAQLRAE